MLRILIVGAGFSGAITAAQLLRQAPRDKARHITLLNRSGPMARGLAYGTQSAEHCLNVPAGNMSAFPDQPDHFLHYAQARQPAGTPVHAGSFVARSLYGDYLEHVLLEAERQAGPHARLERRSAEVKELRPLGEHAMQALCADGTHLQAERVILAFGHFLANDPPIADRAFYASDRYLRDPWEAARLAAIAPGARILLLGSSLTAVDVALPLLSRGTGTHVSMVSRHGLLPQAHRAAPRPAPHAARPRDIWGGATSVRAQMRALRAHIGALEGAGGDWRDVIGALRPATPAIWHAWSERERRRFLRHLQPYWDSHRHRLAPQVAQRLAQERAAGYLDVCAARVLALQATPAGVRATLAPRGGGRGLQRQLDADYVVNCTGPCAHPGASTSPLLRQMLAAGLLRIDALGLGLALSPDGAMLDAEGAASTRLFYIGPWLRARDWEATAVPELRQWAQRLSQFVLAA